MAEFDTESSEEPLLEGDASPEEPSMDLEDEGTTETDPFTAEAVPDPNDPQYKYWQGAYTKTVEHYRNKYKPLEAEHQQFGDVLRQFYQSDEYALQVLRQRFPQLADRLSLDGTSPRGRTQPASGASSVEAILKESLGEDLGFLATGLSPALEQAIEAKLAPLLQQLTQQQQTTREAEQSKLMAEMDSTYPGWETRATAMQEMQQFLASDQVTHPKFGNKMALLLKLVNPDLARVEAARSMTASGRSRLTTGRAGPPGVPNVDETVRAAKSTPEAFRAAAAAALQELGRR